MGVKRIIRGVAGGTRAANGGGRSRIGVLTVFSRAAMAFRRGRKKRAFVLLGVGVLAFRWRVLALAVEGVAVLNRLRKRYA